MGNTTASHPQQRIQKRSRQATSQGQHQTRTQSLPPQSPPSVMTALPDTDHLSSTDHPSKNVLAMSTPPNDVTVPDSPNSIMASAIPEVYYSNDMVHIDSPEPALSIDPSVPSYVSANGEISQAYPEADPYITNYVELYGVPPPPPLDATNGIRGNTHYQRTLSIPATSIHY